MLPRFGDDVSSSARRVGRPFEAAYHAYQDPQILALLGERINFESLLLGRTAQATAQPPALESMVFEDAGHAILRSKGDAGLTAALTFGPYGGFHGHLDKLSFVFYGFGKELGVDPGRARSQAYRLPIHTHWYKATIAHNTVLVDGQSQKPAAGKLLFFEPKGDYTAVAARCEEAYPGVTQTRWLVLTATYLLVVDRLQSEKEHRFDWLYHNRGQMVACDAAREDVTLAGKLPGGEYLRNARRGTTDGVIRAQFEGAGVTTRLTMAGGASTGVTAADGVGGSVDERVPMIMVAREGREVLFAAVLEPVHAGGSPQVTGVGLSAAEAGISVTVESGSHPDRMTIRPDDKVAVVLAR
jgi:oligo-alginate lyase